MKLEKTVKLLGGDLEVGHEGTTGEDEEEVEGDCEGYVGDGG